MSRLREKTTATLLIAIFMISVFAVAAYAIEGTFLDADGTTGTEDRIVIDMPVGFTLAISSRYLGTTILSRVMRPMSISC